jgi:4-hydroxy-tetrahydrodipicolinate reductase
MIKLALCGAGGRMCRTVYKTLIGSHDFEIVFGVDPYPADDLPYPVYRSFKDSVLEADVVIDFSKADSIDEILAYAVAHRAKIVLATTGYSDDQQKRINYASRQISVFQSSNMSLGVNLLANLSKEAMKFLGESYDVEIVEMHHNQKLDAPSGTAVMLANEINSVRDNSLLPVYGRRETAHRRGKNEIGIHSVRGGTVVGKHDVMFLGAGEVVKLSHEAESKEVFVRGALRAAAFLMTKSAGLFDMNSILGDFYAVTTVNCESGISLVNLPSISVGDFLGLLDSIKQNDINLDMISQNFNSDGSLAVSFTMSDKDFQTVEKMIPSALHHKSTVGKSKITAEGAGMEHKSGIALEVLTLLRNLGAKVYAITTSETKISCCIDTDFISAAEQELKKFYGI